MHATEDLLIQDATPSLFYYADMPLERKTPVAYPDGVYEIAGQDRPNVLLIANVTQNGLTGFASSERTALFIFFGEYMTVTLLFPRKGAIDKLYTLSGFKRGWKMTEMISAMMNNERPIWHSLIHTLLH